MSGTISYATTTEKEMLHSPMSLASGKSLSSMVIPWMETRLVEKFGYIDFSRYASLYDLQNQEACFLRIGKVPTKVQECAGHAFKDLLN